MAFCFFFLLSFLLFHHFLAGQNSPLHIWGRGAARPPQCIRVPRAQPCGRFLTTTFGSGRRESPARPWGCSEFGQETSRIGALPSARYGAFCKEGGKGRGSLEEERVWVSLGEFLPWFGCSGKATHVFSNFLLPSILCSPGMRGSAALGPPHPEDEGLTALRLQLQRGCQAAVPRTSLSSIKVHRIPAPTGRTRGAEGGGPAAPPGAHAMFVQRPALLPHPKNHLKNTHRWGRGMRGDALGRRVGWALGRDAGRGGVGGDPDPIILISGLCSPTQILAAGSELTAVSVTAQTRCHHTEACIRSLLQCKKPNFYSRGAHTHTEQASLGN